MKQLIEEYEFNGLRVRLYDVDLEHALSEHPGEVTREAISKLYSATRSSDPIDSRVKRVLVL